jgi:hypothetical protein
LCAAAEAGRTRAAEGNNRQENFSPLKSDGPHFSFREKSWRACTITMQRSTAAYFALELGRRVNSFSNSA